MSRDRGALALVLHAHMPYVEGFGTWPFGEEWLFEAVATVYLPLLAVIRDEPVTVVLTPVLCDQLEALSGEAGERLRRFLREVRAAAHEREAAALERDREPALAAEVKRAAGDYESADQAFAALGDDLLGALARLVDPAGVELWASSATHALLPLLATDAGLRLQIGAGMAAHSRRFRNHEGGFWLPECAYEPGLEWALAEQGVRAFCVDQTTAGEPGSLDQLEPVTTPAGPVAVPIDWQTVQLVWDGASGYPVSGGYRDYHHRTIHGLKPWNNDGKPYSYEAALRLAREHASDFVARAISRLDAYRSERGRPGLLCCPLDAELLGHWWYEGPAWLAGVFAEAHAQGLAMASVTNAISRSAPVERPLAASTWAAQKDLRTWDSPRTAELVSMARRAELRTIAAATRIGDSTSRSDHRDERASDPRGGWRSERRPPAAADALGRAARELLALQSSDWAFQVSRELAGGYPLERAHGHEVALDEALAAIEDGRPGPDSALRNLAPQLDLSLLGAP